MVQARQLLQLWNLHGGHLSVNTFGTALYLLYMLVCLLFGWLIFFSFVIVLNRY